MYIHFIPFIVLLVFQVILLGYILLNVSHLRKINRNVALTYIIVVLLVFICFSIFNFVYLFHVINNVTQTM
jgi:hypothetical protein